MVYSTKKRVNQLARERRSPMKPTKFQADLASSDEAVLNALMKDMEVRSKADFLAKAIHLLKWAVTERKKGFKIVTVSADGLILRELVTPELERVAPEIDLPSAPSNWTNVELESFGKLASEEQPKPKEHLIRAMNKR